MLAVILLMLAVIFNAKSFVVGGDFFDVSGYFRCWR